MSARRWHTNLADIWDREEEQELKKMSNREMLYRAVLMQGGSACADSPNLPSRELSPMSSLALNFHTASLANTPRRKLSLSSSISSDSPLSIHDSSYLSINMLNEGTDIENMEDSTLMSPPSNNLMSPPSSNLMSPPATSILSPSRKMLSRNKENVPSPYFSPSHSVQIPHRPRSSPLKDVQNTVRNLSFSPMKKKLQMISPTKRVLVSPNKPSPPDDFDSTSQDSGYSESGKKIEDTCFSVPVSCAPRKLNLDTPPKVQTVISQPKVPTATTAASLTALSAVKSTTVERKPFRRFTSLSKDDEEDAMLMDLMNETSSEEDHPMGLSTLLSAPIQKLQQSPVNSSAQASRPAFKRCLSMVDITPTSSRTESLGLDDRSSKAHYGRFKRPEAPADLSSFIECKKRREEAQSRIPSPLNSNSSALVPAVGTSSLTQRQVSAPESSCTPKPRIMRSHSESHVTIMKALNKSSTHNGDLIGDFSKPIALPTIDGGKHPDLKAISVDTMADLLCGKYENMIASFRIVDCRYPYEFEGGHIKGAELFHHPQMIVDHLLAQKGAPIITKDGTPRHILIFHCEYSAERGPKAQRLLRENDRTTNKEHYPALHFPETYLLEGGYKAFFEKYPELCTPECYVRMLDSNHSEDLKHFRGKSKSWQAENKQSKTRNIVPRPGMRHGL